MNGAASCRWRRLSAPERCGGLHRKLRRRRSNQRRRGGGDDASGSGHDRFSAPAADHGWIAAITKNAKAQAEEFDDVTLNAIEGTNDVNLQIA